MRRLRVFRLLGSATCILGTIEGLYGTHVIPYDLNLATRGIVLLAVGISLLVVSGQRDL